MKLEVELLTEQGNNAVLLLPDRRYPGLVVQGDSLSILWNVVLTVCSHAERLGDEDLSGDVYELRELVGDMVERYELVLDAAGIELPYARRAR
jgi:hypothetical protein